jgi:hypothetical protein
VLVSDISARSSLVAERRLSRVANAEYESFIQEIEDQHGSYWWFGADEVVQNVYQSVITSFGDYSQRVLN